MSLAEPVELDLVPPADELRAQLAPLRGRLIAISDYTTNLDRIPAGAETVVQNGMTIHLPDPFTDAPAIGAVVRRAKGRSSSYNEGNGYFFQWAIRFMQYAMGFGGYADQLAGIYDNIGPAGPTPSQREQVLKAFNKLQQQLAADRDVLVKAEKGFLGARELLEEDKKTFGGGAAEMNRAIKKFQDSITAEMLRYMGNPVTAPMGEMLGKIGLVRVEQLRSVQSAIAKAADACNQAYREVGLLAGQLLVLIGRYRGVEDALKVAEGVAFKKYMGQFKLTIAKDTWSNLQTFVMKIFITGK